MESVFRAITLSSRKPFELNFLMTLEGNNGLVSGALTEILKVSAAQFGIDLLDKAVPADIRLRHSGQLFMVLCELTAGEANTLVRSMASNPEYRRCGFAAFYALSHRF